MRFEFPHYLGLIPVAIVALALFYWWVRRRKRRLLEQFGRHDIIQKLTRGVSVARQNWKYALLVLAIVLILFSIARPQYGIVERPLRRRGVEVVIAIDCSASMLAQDIKPNRLERARQQLRGLVQRLQGDNVAIVAFAGIAIIQCPMTADYDMALNLLDSISIDSVPVQGTDIGAAIRKALQTYQNSGSNYKALVLLTDGEDNQGQAEAAAAEAAKQGVRIYAIGIGSQQGALIPTTEGGYKESGGSKVDTRLDFEMLKKLAFATGGKAILANPAGDLELTEVTKDIAALKERDLQGMTQTQYAERFQYFLLPAILLLALEMLLGERRRRIETGAGRFD